MNFTYEMSKIIESRRLALLSAARPATGSAPSAMRETHAVQFLYQRRLQNTRMGFNMTDTDVAFDADGATVRLDVKTGARQVRVTAAPSTAYSA